MSNSSAVDLNLLPEDPDERRQFDQFLSNCELSPLRAIEKTLRIWHLTHPFPNGSQAKQMAIYANELGKYLANAESSSQTADSGTVIDPYKKQTSDRGESLPPANPTATGNSLSEDELREITDSLLAHCGLNYFTASIGKASGNRLIVYVFPEAPKAAKSKIPSEWRGMAVEVKKTGRPVPF